MSDAPSRRPFWQRTLIALAPLVALLVLAELVLWAVQPAEASSADRSRGFDATAHYLVPDAETPGGFKTQIFMGTNVPETVIPPKGAARRVLLFGGSNTMLLPEYILEETLDELDPEQDWEVFNLGRAGYGSERVAILFEQALQLEPDLMVVYSGHNEFVERGFAMEIAGAIGDSWKRRALDWAAKLRTYRWLSERARGPKVNPLEASAPEPVAAQPTEFVDLQWEQTGTFYDLYEQNLQRMAELADGAGVEALFCTVISNTWSPPHVSTPSDALPPADAKRMRTLFLRARKLLPEGSTEIFFPASRLRVMPWYQDDAEDRPVPALRELLGELAVAPAFVNREPLLNNGTPEQQDRKAYSVEGAHWPPPERWGTQVFDLLDALDGVIQRDITEAEKRDTGKAIMLLEEALTIDPEQPDVLFMLGIARWLYAEDDALAAEALHRSAAFDRAPRRASDTSNARVRRVVANAQSARLADLDTWFRARNPDGIVGYETMMDHCHLQPGARVVVLQQLAAGILSGEY